MNDFADAQCAELVHADEVETECTRFELLREGERGPLGQGNLFQGHGSPAHFEIAGSKCSFGRHDQLAGLYDDSTSEIAVPVEYEASIPDEFNPTISGHVDGVRS